MDSNSGNAPSSSSIATPSNEATAAGISNSRNRTGVSAPSIAPDAIRNNNPYAICPAPPVTATVTGAVRPPVLTANS
ncbi:hypothetical protein GCM10009764_10980 [Nocardia ninae]|uniref:Uncharacterized protein n=1 Tax=Nocardia ninae NBRC 108245 TaxID=1210091 RepID=A0A511MST2_9NOCA|nr:hypothetical protein NN4_77660 [Nocardia ninae NBRC 108245]